jgi:lipid-A-disaccharide synthase
MKYYLIAGEASGDLHGANLIKALTKQDANADFRAWGGDLMQAAGSNVVKHYKDLAFMGFSEVVKNLGTILNNFKFCKKDILEYAPDVLILIDYPGFNLRMAKWAKKQGIKVFYYISPQIWAWHSSRVHGIKKTVDKMFVILPFEKAFYQKYDFDVDFVGHPLLDVVADFGQKQPLDFRKKHGLSDKPIIALLPGSRKQEIRTMLAKMLTIVSQFTDYQFVIAGAPSQPLSFYQTILQHNQVQIPIIENETYALLHEAHAALVTSGTATLETALFEVPQVVCYQGNYWSYLLAKRLVNVKYISLVNLILDKMLVRELIQEEFNEANLVKELTAILDEKRRSDLQNGYVLLKEKLGNAGASARAAELMVGYLEG